MNGKKMGFMKKAISKATGGGREQNGAPRPAPGGPRPVGPTKGRPQPIMRGKKPSF